MIRSKKINIICIIAIIIAAAIFIIITAGCFIYSDNTESPPITDERFISAEYEDKLFDNSFVHEIDIQISDFNWEYTTKNALDEIYVLCSAVIDGEKIDNIAIRPKGNSSLSSISERGDTHFSFKIDFDYYNTDNTYYGLDKLSLNNLELDPSCMKDFMAYHMMNTAGIAAPLSSYAHIKLNGEDFGLYLAVEVPEDSFSYRNYGTQYGNLYKPDNFAMENIDFSAMLDTSTPDAPLNNMISVFNGEKFKDADYGERADILSQIVVLTFKSMGVVTDVAAVKYIGDDVSLYNSLFDTAAFPVTNSDKRRVVNAIKTINTSENPQSALDVESVLKYFAVHNFTNNYDSYTSVFAHNFYLHEKDGKLSMVPWDYNLAFGSFTYESAIKSIMGNTGYDFMPDTGNAMDYNKSMVNYPIDTPTYMVDLSERPMLGKLLDKEEYISLYHEYMSNFIADFFDTGYYDVLYNRTYENIKPYIESGQTFYTTEQFEKGAEAMGKYCKFRTESIKGQIDGTIPATIQGQQEKYDTLVEPSELDLADLTDFNGLLPALDTEEITTILDIIVKDRNSKNTKGIVDAFMNLSVSDDAVSTAIKIYSESALIRDTINSAIMPYIYFIVSIIVLVVAFLVIRKYRRRRWKDCS